MIASAATRLEPMKIALVSDVHLSVGALPFPDTAADVMVIAGDVARPAKAIAWACESRIPAIYVAGNHEFYGSDLTTTYQTLRRLAEGTPVRVLERTEWLHGGVRFLGCTLWSDYRLFGSDGERAHGLDEAQRMIRDFSAIRVAPDFAQLFSPAVARLLFDQSVAWLEACFARPHPGPTVVVTHFAPALQSIAPRFAGSPLNACFVSDLSEQIGRWQPALWLHGHTHDSFDYRVGRTRVVCNARVYVQAGRTENALFDPHLVLELEA